MFKSFREYRLGEAAAPQAPGSEGLLQLQYDIEKIVTDQVTAAIQDLQTNQNHDITSTMRQYLPWYRKAGTWWNRFWHGSPTANAREAVEYDLEFPEGVLIYPEAFEELAQLIVESGPVNQMKDQVGKTLYGLQRQIVAAISARFRQYKVELQSQPQTGQPVGPNAPAGPGNPAAPVRGRRRGNAGSPLATGGAQPGPGPGNQTPPSDATYSGGEYHIGDYENKFPSQATISRVKTPKEPEADPRGFFPPDEDEPEFSTHSEPVPDEEDDSEFSTHSDPVEDDGDQEVQKSDFEKYRDRQKEIAAARDGYEDQDAPGDQPEIEPEGSGEVPPGEEGDPGQDGGPKTGNEQEPAVRDDVTPEDLKRYTGKGHYGLVRNVTIGGQSYTVKNAKYDRRGTLVWVTAGKDPRKIMVPQELGDKFAIDRSYGARSGPVKQIQSDIANGVMPEDESSNEPPDEPAPLDPYRKRKKLLDRNFFNLTPKSDYLAPVRNREESLGDESDDDIDDKTLEKAKLARDQQENSNKSTSTDLIHDWIKQLKDDNHLTAIKPQFLHYLSSPPSPEKDSVMAFLASMGDDKRTDLLLARSNLLDNEDEDLGKLRWIGMLSPEKARLLGKKIDLASEENIPSILASPETISNQVQESYSLNPKKKIDNVKTFSPKDQIKFYKDKLRGR